MAAGPYKVLKVAKVAGEGGFDYVSADSAGRRLYIPRSGPSARITVFNLDTLSRLAQSPTPARTERWSIPRPITVSPPASPS